MAELVERDYRVSVDYALDPRVPRLDQRALLREPRAVVHQAKVVDPLLRGVGPIEDHQAVPVVKLGFAELTPPLPIHEPPNLADETLLTIGA